MNSIKFKATDVLNWDDAIGYRGGGYNPHRSRPWLLHDQGYVVCVVWASDLQDALDAAVDAHKMDRLHIDPADFGDYGETDDEQWENMTCLGNAGEPFDLETLGVIEIEPEAFWSQFDAVELTPECLRFYLDNANGLKVKRFSGVA